MEKNPKKTLEDLQKEQGPLTDEQKAEMEKKAAEARAQIDAALNNLALEQAEREHTNVFEIAARYTPNITLAKAEGGMRKARITLEPRQRPKTAPNSAKRPVIIAEADNRAKRRREAKKAAKIGLVNFKKNG